MPSSWPAGSVLWAVFGNFLSEVSGSSKLRPLVLRTASLCLAHRRTRLGRQDVSQFSQNEFGGCKGQLHHTISSEELKNNIFGRPLTPSGPLQTPSDPFRKGAENYSNIHE